MATLYRTDAETARLMVNIAASLAKSVQSSTKIPLFHGQLLGVEPTLDSYDAVKEAIKRVREKTDAVAGYPGDYLKDTVDAFEGLVRFLTKEKDYTFKDAQRDIMGIDFKPIPEPMFEHFYMGMGIIFITHNLAVVASLCDSVSVMYAGTIVEQGSVADIFYRSAHPYTGGLLRAVPRIDMEDGEKLIPIKGQSVDMLHMPEGCPYAPRCEFCTDRCTKAAPPVTVVGEGHTAACWRLVPEETKAKEDENHAG